MVYGLATDYCVKAAVEGLLDRGCRVAVVVDAVRAIDHHVETDLFRSLDGPRRRPRTVMTDALCRDDGAGDAVI